MSEQQPLRILQALGDELERATLADDARVQRSRWHWPSLPLVALVLGLSATGVAAAATHLFGLAAPVSAPPRADVAREARPLPSTAALAGVVVADPDGLPSWDVRVSHTATGDICTAVGQVQGKTFGILGLDQKFRALPLGAADACGRPPGRGRLQIGARVAIGGGTVKPRTLVVGVAGPGITRIKIYGPDALHPPRVRLGRDRVFLAVMPGLPDVVQPTVEAYSGAVQSQFVNLASNEVDETSDNQYGPGWTYSAGPEARFVHTVRNGQLINTVRGGKLVAGLRPRADTACVQATQDEDPTAAGTDEAYQRAQTPLACWTGRRPAVVADIRRLVPSGGGGHYSYGLNPARTIIQGIASRSVENISVPVGPHNDPVLSLAISPSTGAFYFMLDGKTDPTALRLRVKFTSGRVEFVRSSGTLIDQNGRAYSLPRAPARRDLAAVRAQTGDGSSTTEQPGTARMSDTVPDPAGGPAWAARTWLTTSSRGGARARPLVCATFGPVVDGEVRQAFGAGAGKIAPSARQGSVRCSALTQAKHQTVNPSDAFAAFPTVYVDDPTSPTPHVARIAVSSVFAGVTAATVESSSGQPPVRATVGPRGSVLALLPAAYGTPGVRLRLDLTFEDGTKTSTDWYAFSPQLRVPVVRAPDPGGAASWALQPAAVRTPSVPGNPGQLIDGRLGMIVPATGAVHWVGGGSSGFASTPRDRSHPVWFESQPFLDSPSNQPGPAQVTRRIEPGRTVIYGRVVPGTQTVTIQTPRDVRTVRPSKPGGLFLSVYDGTFTQGRIVVTAHGPGIHGSATKRVDR